jgi:hypothetical protein
MPTAQRRPTEAELAIPQQPSQEFLSKVAGEVSAQEQTQERTMEIKRPDTLSRHQTAQTQPIDLSAVKRNLSELHNEYMQNEENTTETDRHPEGYITYHAGRDASTEWALVPSYTEALEKIEKSLGHPMLLGGLLTVAAGLPAYLETRAGYGKTTMAIALAQRIDSLYERLEKNPDDKEAARELAQMPFADVVIIEPKGDVAELVGYLYVASVADPERGYDPMVANELAEFLHAEGLAQSLEDAKQKAEKIVRETVDSMTGGAISGTTAIAPTAEIKTALARATRWRMPKGRMAKPVLFVYDDAHTPIFLRMIDSRLKTALASNTMYGMPYLNAVHLLFANPNQEEIADELASRLMPWITPANVTSDYGRRGRPTLSERIRQVGRKVANAALKKVLAQKGMSIGQVKDIQQFIQQHADDIQKAFDKELDEGLGKYGLPRTKAGEIRKISPSAVQHLSSDLGIPHYMDAIATAVSRAGLDAVTAGWHWRPDDEVDVDNIYSLYAETPGFKAAYTPEELRKVAERHAAFANAVLTNEATADAIFKEEPYMPPDWKKTKAFIDAHISSPIQKVNWYNERSAMNRKDTIVAGPDRSPRDWLRFVFLPALFGAMGRPDMAAYTIGAIGGINPEVSMPKITVANTPAEIDSELDKYFKPENLLPSVQAMLDRVQVGGKKLTPEEYAAGLKGYARSVIFTTQPEGGAGEHTIYSILEPHVETILRHRMGNKAPTLAHEIAIGLKNPSQHTTSDIHEGVKWYEAHKNKFKELFEKLYRQKMGSGTVGEEEIRKNAEDAHAALSTLARLMRSMHATVALGAEERNAILKSAQHARQKLASPEGAYMRKYVASAARMAAALRRFAERGRYEDLSEKDKKELHKFGHLVALAHATDSNGQPVLGDKLSDIKDLVETVHGLATTSSQARAGTTVEGIGNFDALKQKNWSAEFAETLAKILSP